MDSFIIFWLMRCDDDFFVMVITEYLVVSDQIKAVAHDQLRLEIVLNHSHVKYVRRIILKL
jgi:hypothetical protein